MSGRIAAGAGVALRIATGRTLAVINTHGVQVVDTWAFADGDGSEHLSMEHSRTAMLRLVPRVGDTLASNRRRAMLTLVEDTSGGVHDTLIAACDTARYRQLGVSGHHASCADNLRQALAALGLTSTHVPAPLNLFMNVPVGADGALAFAAPASPPGGHVALRAEMDLIVVLSACPQDVTPVNAHRPSEVHYAVR